MTAEQAAKSRPAGARWIPPPESFRDMPRAYRAFVIAAVLGGVLITALALPYLNLRTTLVVGAIVLISYVVVPTAPRAGGGLRTFLTPTLYSMALLADPAAALVGTSVAGLLGSMFVWRRPVWRASVHAIGVASLVVGVFPVQFLLKSTNFTFAMLVAPMVVVAVGYPASLAPGAAAARYRYGFPFWAELRAGMTENVGDQALDAWFVMPIAIGMVLTDPVWWPAWLLGSVAMSRLNAAHMLAQASRFGEGRTRFAAHTVPTEDPQLREVAEELGQGVALATADGVILSMTDSATRAFGRSSLPSNVALGDLCVPEDAGRIARALDHACRTSVEAIADVRVLDASGASRRLRLGFVNRLFDPTLRRIVVTVRDITEGTTPFERLGAYVDHALASQLLATHELEVGQVAQDLENARQVLAMTSHNLVAVEGMLHTLQRATGALQRGLRPPALDDLGLLEALRAYCAEAKTEGLNVDLQGELGADQRFARDLELTAYRIVHEGLEALCRGEPASATVTLGVRGPALVITVEKASAGVADRGLSPHGVMLTILHERARLVGGTFRVDRSERDHVRLMAELPTDAHRRSASADLS